MDVDIIYNQDCIQGMKAIPDKSIDMILCDLPYGTTACKWDSLIPFDALWNEYNRIIKDDSAIVLFGSEPFSTLLRQSNLKNFRYDWIWEKEQGANFMLCKYQPYKVHEIISVFSKKRHRYFPQMTNGTPYISGKGTSGDITGNVKKIQTINNGTRYPRSVQKFNTDKAKGSLHPTQKPVALLEYLIKTYTNEGEIVLDNAFGSGSTLIAAFNTNRHYIGYELDGRYFDIACKRLDAAEREREQKGIVLIEVNRNEITVHIPHFADCA
jgi:site-specific DNA-methyltransferase (adenine-specific)